MKYLGTLLIVAAAGIFLYICIGFFKKFFPGGNTVPETSVEEIESANIIGKIKFKLVSYREALEASREFIYSIAKAVMEKFSPAAKESLLTIGTTMMRAGMQYIHTVDVFKISLDRQRVRIRAEKEQRKLQQK